MKEIFLVLVRLNIVTVPRTNDPHSKHRIVTSRWSRADQWLEKLGSSAKTDNWSD
jgi:hypothetical protein